MDQSYKILWKDNPIAKIKKGKNYLSPEIEIIADDNLEISSKRGICLFF